MAIQHRRGGYTDFDPTKMKPGEFAVVQEGDPQAEDGEGVYMAFGAGRVKRMATLDELHSYDDDAHRSAQEAEQSKAASQRILEQTTSEKQAAQQARKAAESSASQAAGSVSTIEAKAQEATNAAATAGTHANTASAAKDAAIQAKNAAQTAAEKAEDVEAHLPELLETGVIKFY